MGTVDAEIQAGAVLAETYEVTRLLGQGGMGAVWEATHLRLPGKRVAIKVLLGVADPGSEVYLRFRREAEIASRLGHPNIVEVHDFNLLPSGKPYLVLEFLEGESLEARLARGPLTLEQALSIARQIGSALQAAHIHGVVHRDLKPANVFLVSTVVDGEPAIQVKVLDFGISKIRGSQTLQTKDMILLGTPQYMAPEQAQGRNTEIDARTDEFALGAIVYETLTGKPPFSGENLPEVVYKIVHERPQPLNTLVPGLPVHVIATVERALEKNADQRFPDVTSFIAALTQRASPMAANSLVSSVSPLAGTVASATTPASTPAPAAVSGPASVPSGSWGSDSTVASARVPVLALSPPTSPSSPLPTSPTSPTPPPAALIPSMPTPPPTPPPTPLMPSMPVTPATPPATTPEAVAVKPAPELASKLVAPPPKQMSSFTLAIFLSCVVGLMAFGAVGISRWIHGDETSSATSGTSDIAPTAPTAASAPTSITVPKLAPISQTARDMALAPLVRPAPTAPTGTTAATDAATAPTAPATAPTGTMVVVTPAQLTPLHREKTSNAEALPPEDLADLDQAEKMLAIKNVEEAIRLARKTLNTKKTSRAYGIMTRAYCIEGDLGDAMANLRSVALADKSQVVRFCRSVGTDVQ
jgi:serine/threonine-protein kinase